MAPNHVDLSVVYVPLMPETSKFGPAASEAMEKAAQEGTEAFSKGSSGLGDKIHDSFTKATGKVKDVFHKAGNDASESMADGVKENSTKVEAAVEEAGDKAKGKFRESAKGWGKVLVDAVGPDTKKLLGDRLEETVGGALEGVLGDNAKWAGQFSHAVADWGFDELKNKLGDTKEAADKTRKAFADFGKGDVSGGVSTLIEGFEKLGGDVKDLPEPLRGILGDISDMQSAAEDFAGVFKDLPGVIGRIGTAIEGLSGPLGIAAAGALAIWNGLPGIGGGLSDILAAPDPTKGFNSPIQGPPGIPTTGPVTLPPSLGGNTAGVAPPGYTATQGSLDPFAGLLPPGMAPPPGAASLPVLAPPDMPDGTPAPPVFSIPPSMRAAAPPHPTAPSSLTSGGSTVPLVQNPDGTWTSPNPSWAHLIQRESGGRPSVFNNYDSNAQAGDPSQGLFQFTRATWARSGGLKYGADPSKATPQQQAEIAANLIRANPSGSDWGAGLSGRESASGLLSGLGAGGATSTGWWSSRDGTMPTDTTTSASGVGGRGGAGGLGSSGGLGIPTGAQHDPLYIMPADSTGGAGGSSSTQDQAQQLGSGLVNGVLQEFGLDGSVFKSFGGSSNPLHFGITKLATGLINTFAGGGGQGGSLGGGGSILPGLGSLIPHPHANSVPIGPGGAQNVPSGDTHVYGNSGPTLNVTQNGSGQSPTQELQETANGAGNRTQGMTAPNYGNLPATGSG
jgi:hypothetical protein